MNALRKASWSPYAVGAGIGALSWFTFLTAKKPIGVTTPFESTAAGLAQKLAPRASGVNAYLAKAETTPAIDWEWMLVAGIGVGSLLSARASNERAPRGVPALWKRRFGSKPGRRYLAAFVGGLMMMFGARMARGCTSGHAISGLSQLSGASLVFSPIMGVCAALVARALFGRGGRR